MQATGIERFFCSEWSGWDDMDYGVMGLYDAKLLPGVYGPEAITVDFLVVDTMQCNIVVYDKDVEVLKKNFTAVLE